MSAPQPFNADHAHQPRGGGHNPPGTSLPEPRYDSIITAGPLGSWFTLLNAGLRLNEIHSDFRGVFFNEFDALLKEADDEAYVRRMPDYLRRIRSQYMFVRVERPPRSKRFVMGYVKCERVFSFEPRYGKMRLRLSCIPAVVLTKVEHGENKALRLVCVGETDYERAQTKYQGKKAPLCAALWAKDEDAAEALLDGGDDPNEVDGSGQNALHKAAWKGCRPPLSQRLLARIHDGNAVDWWGNTALMYAAGNNRLGVVISVMSHPRIDLNVQDRYNNTALHIAVFSNHPAIVSQLLSDDKIDASLKDHRNRTALKHAIDRGYAECAQILRQHGAPEE